MSRSHVTPVQVCPGCGVRATSQEAEHLNDCSYQGRNALPFKTSRHHATETYEDHRRLCKCSPTWGVSLCDHCMDDCDFWKFGRYAN